MGGLARRLDHLLATSFEIWAPFIRNDLLVSTVQSEFLLFHCLLRVSEALKISRARFHFTLARSSPNLPRHQEKPEARQLW